MKKAKKTKEESRKISKVTIALYIIVLLGAIIFLSVSWGQTDSGGSCCGGGGGCCDCCCGCCAGCSIGIPGTSNRDLFCNMKYLDKQEIDTPYGSMSVLDYYCMMGTIPTPEEPECNPPGEESTTTMVNDPGVDKQDCTLQEGVCAGSEEVCTKDGTWDGCGTDEYRAAAEENGGVYSTIEKCGDHADNNCDGTIDEGCDEDHDGYFTMDMTDVNGEAGTDCDDTNPALHPGATELCDAALVDENCNHQANEGCECVEGTEEVCDPRGVCATVMKQCVNGHWSTCDLSGVQKPEMGPWCADGKDNDCDGQTDCEDSDCGIYSECAVIPP